MPGAKEGKYIFKNLAIGKYAPQGQDIKVTIEDIPTEPAQEFTLKLGDTLRYLPKSDVLRIKIKPKKTRDMKPLKADISNARQATNACRYVVEDENVYRLTVIPQKNFIKDSRAWPYQPFTIGKIIDA